MDFKLWHPAHVGHDAHAFGLRLNEAREKTSWGPLPNTNCWGITGGGARIRRQSALSD